MKVLKIGYDANFAIGQYRGMGKYINAFTKVLSIKFGVETIALLRGGQNITDRTTLSFGFSNYVFWEQISLKRYAEESEFPIFFPYNTAPLLLRKSPRNVLILHDLIFMKSSNTKSIKQKLGRAYRAFIVPRIISKFAHIITVSEFSKNQIVEKLAVDPNLIHVIPNSIYLTNHFTMENPGLTVREDTIFHIGGEPDYKNSKLLLYAFAKLPENIRLKFKLKILGIRDKKTIADYIEVASALNINDSLTLLDYQTDEEVEVLYKTSKIFVFPSKEEGFGIPILESFKHGCPLICSESSCLPEIAGKAAFYFDPFDVNSLQSAIVKVLAQPEDTELRVQLGYRQCEKYSLESFSDKVITWYQNYLMKARNENC